jgi:mRNA interferase MazF
MKEGDVLLAAVPQADDQTKLRPVVFLRTMPPYGDLLVCGVSSQLHQQVLGFDELLTPEEPGFASTGLLAPSIVRLGFLAVLSRKKIAGAIGSLGPFQHRQLLERLARHLLA